MEQFFTPNTVAIIGASSKKGKIGYEILSNTLKSDVEVFPVNPLRTTILGKKCYKSVTEINQEVDLAVIAVSAKECIPILENCGKKGIKHVIIISGGFKEIGNIEYEKTIVRMTRKYQMRVIGPNCVGIFNGKNRFNTFFQRHMDLPPYGEVAVLTQSGAFGIALLEKLNQEKIGLSKFISFGNKADIDELDLIDFLENDESVKLIALYVEEIKREFFEKKITKPIIILKAGRSTLGQKAAYLHTGAMATKYNIFKGLCRQKNIIYADDFEEFFGIIKIIAMQGFPKGKNISIVTNGAGPSVLACDFLDEAQNLNLFQNIIDLTGNATADDYLNAIKNNTADIILLTFVFQDAPLAESLSKLYCGLTNQKRFFIAITLGGSFVEKQKNQLAHLKIPTFEEPWIAIHALNKVIEYYFKT
jgi:acyl-CoA synthetase (NDP forming)